MNNKLFHVKHNIVNTIDLAFQRSRGIAPTLTGVCRLKVEAEIVVRHGAQEGGRDRGRRCLCSRPASRLPPLPPLPPSTPPSLTVSLRLFGREGAVSSERANANGGLKAKKANNRAEGRGVKFPQMFGLQGGVSP